MINLQEGIDMQTVSSCHPKCCTNADSGSLQYMGVYTLVPSVPNAIARANIYRAVHNFCTSQKAVSNSNAGVIGGAHRGGKQIRLPSSSSGLKLTYYSTSSRRGSLPESYYISQRLPQKPCRSFEVSRR